MGVLAQLIDALGGARITGSRTRRDETRIEHFWSIQGGRTAHLVEIRGRFVEWHVIDKPMGVVWRESDKRLN